MSRKEEIVQAKESAVRSIPIPELSAYSFSKGFQLGAEWADENPSEANIAMYLGKKGWSLSTNGIPTYEEAAKSLDKYYEYKKKQWIDKACKWIGSHLLASWQGEYLEDFKKAMEE